jgi:hypothetical protein
LLDRANFNVMTKYISDQQNLKLMMNLLRDKSKNIQFEAFHVFKVFVANPNKAKPILDILTKNKEKLISFLSNFHNEKGLCYHTHDTPHIPHHTHTHDTHLHCFHRPSSHQRFTVLRASALFVCRVVCVVLCPVWWRPRLPAQQRMSSSRTRRPSC